MKWHDTFFGALLILIGVLFLVDQIFYCHFFSMDNFWPVFVLVPGLAFEFSYFSTGKHPGVLVPGGILTTLGILFFFETYTNWMFSSYTWPIYPLAVAIGLFQFYIFGGREVGVLIPAFILTVVSITAFSFLIFGSLLSWGIFRSLLAVALILTGVFVMLRK